MVLQTVKLRPVLPIALHEVCEIASFLAKELAIRNPVPGPQFPFLRGGETRADMILFLPAGSRLPPTPKRIPITSDLHTSGKHSWILEEAAPDIPADACLILPL